MKGKGYYILDEGTYLKDLVPTTASDDVKGFQILWTLSMSVREEDFVAPVFHLNKETGRYESEHFLGVEFKILPTTYKTYKGIKLVVYDMVKKHVVISEFMRRKEKRDGYINQVRLGTKNHFMRSKANVTYSHPYTPFGSVYGKLPIFLYSANENNLDTLVLGKKGKPTLENCTGKQKVKNYLRFRHRHYKTWENYLENTVSPYLNLLGTK